MGAEAEGVEAVKTVLFLFFALFWEVLSKMAFSEGHFEVFEGWVLGGSVCFLRSGRGG